MENNKKQQKFFVTTEEILTGVLQYLGSKPFAEVAHLIDALRQSQEVDPAKVFAQAEGPKAEEEAKASKVKKINK